MSPGSELQERSQVEETHVSLPIRQEEPKDPHGTDHNHVEGLPLFLVMIGLVLCLFLPALDQLILTTAIPRIVSQFNSLGEISWIPNAYFLTMASFMIVYGQILNLAPLKYVISVCVLIFEIGSLLCGVAFNMNFLLFGRAIAGIGAAGLFVCIFAAIAQVAPLEKRARLMGIAGATFGLSSVIGPLVGGVLTDKVSWRWCFYINLPVGGVAAAVVFFFLPNYPAPPRPANRQGWRALLGVDYVGAILVIGMTVTFLFPLVEGGNSHPWNSAIIISLFITSGILLGLFIFWCSYRGPDAILPIRMLKNRSIVGASMAAFFIWMSLMLGSVYIATWYQAVKGASPTKSGIDLLPFSLVSSATSALVGIVVGRVGRYWHILVLAPLVGSVASGLMFTINEHTSSAQIIGFQILWAVSIGATLQQPTIAGQAEYQDSLKDTRYATSLITFVGFIGRMVGLGMGSALFINKLAQNLKTFAPDAPAEVLRSVDAVWALPANDLRANIIHAYVLSLRWIFIIGVPAGGLATLSALFMRDRQLKRKVTKPTTRDTTSQDTELEAMEHKMPKMIIPVVE
ncbi:major facilitator superfamily domain-containing protein [Gautieria morchelliformis]|nr:major facilitator superfamily domain-containing protein [Gautieria morchelliformis]